MREKINKYYTLILFTILVIITFDNYMDYKLYLNQIEREGLPIDLWFNSWSVVYSFFLIMIYEWIISKRLYKLFARILLTLVFLAKTLSRIIPIDDFDSGVENTTVVFGFIAFILLAILGIKRLYIRYIKKKEMPAANKV